MVANSNTIERLLQQWREGDQSARDALFELLFDDLASIASSLLRREGRPISVSTGDLVNEAVVRLLISDELSISDRNHMLSLCARVS